MHPPSMHYVTSTDTTRIGFLQWGKEGPGVVLVQGAMATADNYTDLARELSSDFTVYAPDRRGRGISEKAYDSGHEIARDVEDIDAILAETGANLIFGLSSGAIVTLEAAKNLARITRACVYEPPFYPDGISMEGVRRLNREIETGDLPSALVTALHVAGTAPKMFRLLPIWLACLLASVVLRVDHYIVDSSVRLRDLLPGVRYDFNVVSSMDGKMDMFTSLKKPVLLLSGTKSAPYLRESIRKLGRVLPEAQHVEFVGLDHSGPWNANLGGQPKIVAAALRKFLSCPS